MKRSLLFTALAFAAPLAAAAADPPKSAASADVKTADTAAIDTRAARAELAELRTQMQALSRKMATLSGELGDVGPRAYAYRYIGDPDRGMIGVVLAEEARGQRVTAVTPGSPAAKAGIRNGDVIVDLRGARDSSSGAATRTLSDRLRNLKVDQELTLVVQRDGKPSDIKLRAERREPYNFADALGADGPLPTDFDERIRAAAEQARAQAKLSADDAARIRADAARARDEAQRSARDATREAQRALHDQGRMRVEAERAAREAEREMRRAMPWWGLNLAPVNPELGRYFGTDKGALVIAADNGALPGLHGGDVITSVAGEAVSRPEDALRALRDQPSGADVPIKLMRNHKTLALVVKTPTFKSIFGVPPTPTPAPVTPSIPAAPAAPATPATPITAPPEPPAAPAPPRREPTTAVPAGSAVAAITSDNKP